MLGEVRLQLPHHLVLGHVGDEPQVELRLGAARKNRLAARSGVAADEPLDVDRRLADQSLDALLVILVIDPAADVA